MALSIVGTDSAGSGTGDINLSYPSGVGVGDLITIIAAGDGTPSAPAGYSSVISAVVAGSLTLAIFGKISASESGSVTVSMGTGSRHVAGIFVRRSVAGFNVTVADNYKGILSGSATTNNAAISTTALSGVPKSAMAFSVGAGYIAAMSGTTGQTCTVTGASWGELLDTNRGTVAGSGSVCIDLATNTAASGTLAATTFTFTQTDNARAWISWYIVEAYQLVGGVDAIVETGASASQLYARKLVGGVDALVETGATASQLWAHKLVGGVDAIVETGNTAGLLRRRLLLGSVDALAETGNTAGLLRRLLLLGSVDALTETGATAVFIRPRLLVGGVDALVETGGAAGLFRSHLNPLVGGVDALVETGGDAGLLWRHLLLGDVDALVETGGAAGLLYRRLLTGDADVLVETGDAAGLLYKRLLIGDVNALVETGAPASLLWNHLLLGDVDAILETGGDSFTQHFKFLLAQGGTYILTGGLAFFLKSLSHLRFGEQQIFVRKDGNLVYTSSQPLPLYAQVLVPWINVALPTQDLTARRDTTQVFAGSEVPVIYARD
jgi:hypothetical protein